jgi:hypothetical protein
MMMSRRAFATAGGGLAVSALAAGAKAGAPDALGKSEGVLNVFTSNGRALIMVRSGERTPFPVVFDTGSNGNAIHSSLIKALRLRKVPHTVNIVVDGTTGRRFKAFFYRVPDMRIGSLALGDRDITAYPNFDTDEVGLFGPNLFTGQLVWVDIGGARIRVVNKTAHTLPPGPGTPHIGEKGNGLPAAELVLPARDGSGLPTRVLGKLDSGNDTALILPTEYLDRVPLARPATIVGQSRSVSGSRGVMGGQIMGEVSVGPVTLRDPDVIFDGLAPNIGLPIIRQLRFVVDPQAERTWLISPLRLTRDQMAAYAGQFGVRQVFIRDDALIYRRGDGLERIMIPLGGDVFDLSQAAGVQLCFKRSGDVVSGVTVTSEKNDETLFARTA